MSLIPEDIIAQVLDRCDIVEIVNGYVPLKKTGRNFKACCPFHNEKTPSFVVNPQKQIFHCFGCGAGGNVITFVMKQERLEFPEALRLLARQVAVEIPEASAPDSKTLSERELLFKVNDWACQFFHNNLMNSNDALTVSMRDYLKKRGVNEKILKEAKLGFAPERWDGLINFLRSKDVTLGAMEKAGLIIPQENRSGFYDRFRYRIIFPIFDAKARCVAFGGRAMKEGTSAKYMNSPETPLYVKGQHFYGLHLAKEAIREKDCAIVVEGYMDFIIPHQEGIGNVVASLGTALTTDQIRLLRRYTKNIIMLFDSDQPGESATIRSLDFLIEEDLNVKVATLVQGEDPDSYLLKYGREKFIERLNAAQSLFDYKMHVLLGQHSHKTVEGKQRIASEMLPTIARFRNAVAKFSYIKQLSDVLSVPEQALLVELQKIPKAYGSATEFQLPKESTPKAPAMNLERDLLKLMLIDETFIPVVKEAIALMDFQDDRIRGIMQRVFELNGQGEGTTLNHLMASLADDSLVRELTHLAIDEYPQTLNKEKMLQDYLERIRRDRLHRQQQDLTQKIRFAENSGDHLLVEEYLRQYNLLLKKG